MNAVQATFRAESFNLFNHPQFGQPTLSIGIIRRVYHGTVENARLLQLRCGCSLTRKSSCPVLSAKLSSPGHSSAFAKQISHRGSRFSRGIRPAADPARVTGGYQRQVRNSEAVDLGHLFDRVGMAA